MVARTLLHVEMGLLVCSGWLRDGPYKSTSPQVLTSLWYFGLYIHHLYIHQCGCIVLIKSDSNDFYITKDFFFK